jgi:glycosyltransferase involved in cell wall biosynthesis
VRLLAVLAVRNEMRFLPGCIANLAPQVDGIVALDDDSSDGSAEFLESCETVLEVLRAPRGRPVWDEVQNHRRLVRAALRHGADWILCVDADELLEREFRTRAERVIRRGRALGFSAYNVRLRELWGSVDQFRVDGIWRSKYPARLFRARPDHEFDPRPFHGIKAPMQARSMIFGFPVADLTVYHLRMIHPEDRRARRERYERADPDGRWQNVGYAYLTDETGLRVRRVSASRLPLRTDPITEGSQPAS